MNSSERYLKITEILKKFKNGEELYKKSPLFNQATQMMIEGVDVYDVLEEIIKAAERTSNAFEDYVNRNAGLSIFSDQTPINEQNLKNQKLC